jgi:hypothetical protein
MGGEINMSVNPGYMKIASNPDAMNRLRGKMDEISPVPNRGLDNGDVKDALAGVPGVTDQDIQGFMDTAYLKSEDGWSEAPVIGSHQVTRNDLNVISGEQQAQPAPPDANGQQRPQGRAGENAIHSTVGENAIHTHSAGIGGSIRLTA